MASKENQSLMEYLKSLELQDEFSTVPVQKTSEIVLNEFKGFDPASNPQRRKEESDYEKAKLLAIRAYSAGYKACQKLEVFCSELSNDSNSLIQMLFRSLKSFPRIVLFLIGKILRFLFLILQLIAKLWLFLGNTILKILSMPLFLVSILSSAISLYGIIYLIDIFIVKPNAVKKIKPIFKLFRL
jgi:hypothetical protein